MSGLVRQSPIDVELCSYELVHHGVPARIMDGAVTDSHGDLAVAGKQEFVKVSFVIYGLELPIQDIVAECESVVGVAVQTAYHSNCTNTFIVAYMNVDGWSGRAGEVRKRILAIAGEL